MFKSLFGKKENDPLAGKMKQIESDFANKKFEDVISEGEQIIDQISEKKKPDLLRLLAIAYFQSNNFEKAISYFQELCKVSDNPDYLFNLSTAFILNKEAEKGLATLDDAISLYQTKGKRENTPISFMIFYAMCALTDAEEYGLAYEQLDRLSVVYREISITDNQYLYSRGYVPFSHLLEKIKLIMENQNLADAIAWLTEFAYTLDENGQIQIESMIEDLKAEQHEEKQGKEQEADEPA